MLRSLSCSSRRPAGIGGCAVLLALLAGGCAPSFGAAPPPPPAPVAAAPEVVPCPATPAPQVTIEAPPAAPPPQPVALAPGGSGDFPVARRLELSSTAYCLRGNMRTGVRVRDGMAAGDPNVLPLGSVVRLTHRDGRPIGIFVIMDTGGAIRGNDIDIWLGSCAEATRWGRRPVVAEVLAIGKV